MTLYIYKFNISIASILAKMLYSKYTCRPRYYASTQHYYNNTFDHRKQIISNITTSSNSVIHLEYDREPILMTAIYNGISNYTQV